MSKHGQEDVLNQWQRGWQNLVRLIILALCLGGVITLIWWQLHAPAYSLYYLLQYWYSWLYCRIPFGCSQTAIYNQQVLQPFINQLGELTKSCGVVFSLTSFFSAMGLRCYFAQYNQQLEKKRYLRGSRLLKAIDLNSEIDSARNNQNRLAYPLTSSDLYLGRERVRLPHSLTYRHIALVGISGTGKTQLVSSLLQQIGAKRGHKCLILDLNGQYYARFGQVGDKILSLYDSRSQPWSFYGEVGVPPEFFAAALVEVNESGGNKFFSNAGRALLADIIACNSTSLGIWQDLTSEPAKLLAKLKDGISPSLLGAPEQAAGVIATAIVELGFLKHLNSANQSQDYFSLTDWVLSKSEDWVFLIVKDLDLAASKALLRLWVDLVVGGLLQREEDQPYPHLYIVCDEYPGLGVIPSSGKLLSQGRKYKATMVAGYQLRGQIEHLYGENGAREIIAGLQNKIIFRTPLPKDAKEESLTLGEQDVEEVTSNAQLGELGESDRDSLQRILKTRPAVMASQLQNLADMKAYIKLCEFDPCLISFDYQSLPIINEASRRHLPTKNLNLPQENESQEPISEPATIESSTPESALTCEDDLQWDTDPGQ
jgi:Type IV secretion-system coupling protein DNA-binding domain